MALLLTFQDQTIGHGITEMQTCIGGAQERVMAQWARNSISKLLTLSIHAKGGDDEMNTLVT